MSALHIALLALGTMLTIGSLIAAAVAWHGEGSLVAMRATPTLSAAEVAERHRRASFGAAPLGQAVELVGTVECDAPLQAPYSETLCVAYDYQVCEESEWVAGRPGVRRAREVEYGGHDAQRARAHRFYVRDATGRVAVDPAGARVDMVETVARFEEYTGLGGEREIWRHERALPLGNRVFVLGYLGTEGGAPLIGRHPAARGHPFIISHRGEDSLRARERVNTYGLYVGATLGLAGAAACFLGAYVL